MLFFYRTRDPSLSALWSSGESSGTGDDNGVEANEEGAQATNVRGRIEEAYHDDPLSGTDEHDRGALLSEAANERRIDQGPVMQASRLHDGGNDWREV